MGSCKKITKSVPAFIAWALLLAATVLFFIYPCQFLQSKYHVSIIVFQGIISLFVISNFFLATFSDPGVIPAASPEEDDDDFRAPLFKNVEINGILVRMKWCITCKFYRPPRCSHCSECDTCIETFDHHCPWMNNCIGRRNYRNFFFFLIFLCIHMITVFVWCLLYILSNKERLYETESIVTLALMTLIVLLFIPIIGLTLFHIVLVSRGRTTNEQITGKFQNGDNPFTRGCLLNCCYILCGPKYPKYKLSKKNKEFFRSLETKTVNDASTNDRIVRVYLDHDDKSLIQKSSINNKNQFLLNKNNETKTTNVFNKFNEKNSSTKTADNSNTKIDLALESISQDCEPSPPATVKRVQNVDSSQSKTDNFNAFKNSKLSYYFNSPNIGNQLTSSQSQVLYSQHYPIPVRKLDTSHLHTTQKTTTQQQSNSFDTTNNNEIGLHLISQPGLINHPSSFYHQFNTRPTSPAKITSISEMNPYAHHNVSMTNNRQLIKSNGNQQQSSVVVYYSPPEEINNSLMITDLDSLGNSRFDNSKSETELQKLQLIYSGSENRFSNNDQQSNSNKKSYFFSKSRPMSFKRALEITEQFEKDRSHHNVPNSSTIKSNSTTKTTVSNNEGIAENSTNTKDDNNRHSQYEMNYEISV